jgi:hypothetical protein
MSPTGHFIPLLYLFLPFLWYGGTTLAIPQKSPMVYTLAKICRIITFRDVIPSWACGEINPALVLLRDEAKFYVSKYGNSQNNSY